MMRAAGELGGKSAVISAAAPRPQGPPAHVHRPHHGRRGGIFSHHFLHMPMCVLEFLCACLCACVLAMGVVGVVGVFCSSLSARALVQ